MARTPLDVYLAAVRYVKAASALDSASAEVTAAEQVANVIQLVGNTAFDQGGATTLLEALMDDDSPFSGDQRKAIASTIRSVMSGAAAVATTDSRHMVKEQEHLYIYNYLPAKLWAFAKRGGCH